MSKGIPFTPPFSSAEESRHISRLHLFSRDLSDNKIDDIHPDTFLPLTDLQDLWVYPDISVFQELFFYTCGL